MIITLNTEVNVHLENTFNTNIINMYVYVDIQKLTTNKLQSV